MRRTYEIYPRQDDQGGWKLTLLEDGQEAGGGIFPVPEGDPHNGIAWWNALTEERRAHWLMMAASAMPAAARHAYLLAEAYNDAFEEGESWTARVRKKGLKPAWPVGFKTVDDNAGYHRSAIQSQFPTGRA